MAGRTPDGSAHKGQLRGLLEVALDPTTVVVAVGSGKVMDRVWATARACWRSRFRCRSDGPVAALEMLLATHASEPVIAIEATGSLHRAWAARIKEVGVVQDRRS